MNISGIVVKTAPEHTVGVVAALKAEELCEVHFQDDQGMIIATIEGDDIGEEVKKMRSIMNLPHVLCADLAYSYSDEAADDADPARDAVPEALRQMPHEA